MTQEQIAQLFGYGLMALALLIGLGSTLVDKLKVKNKRDEAQIQILQLQEEVKTLQEKSDLETRRVVNESFSEARQENARLREEAQVRQLEYTKQIGELNGRVSTLQSSLEAEKQRSERLRRSFQSQTRTNSDEVRTLRKQVSELERRFNEVSSELALTREEKVLIERQHELLLEKFEEKLGLSDEQQADGFRAIIEELLRKLAEKEATIEDLMRIIDECCQDIDVREELKKNGATDGN